jgi:hypothetical protein
MKARGYLLMLAALLAFAGLEFETSRLPLATLGVVVLLVLLVVAQTAYFLLVSMHLKDETPTLRRMAALPVLLGLFYAAVLVSESAWRHS